MTHQDKSRELVTKLREDHNSIWQFLMDEAADLITELINALEYAEANDKPDAMAPLIQEAQRAPGYWSIYAQALELVSNRYSKSALVHLTAYLMMREQDALKRAGAEPTASP